MTQYSDLKLIDELLCDLRQELKCSWSEMESHSSVTRDALTRLRNAYSSGEMPVITLGLAKHFQGDPRGGTRSPQET